jgi:acetyl-CoA carboxylase biotin carboxylase subunit
VSAGYRVPPLYDSLLAKVIVRAPDRDAAITRMRRCLAELRIEGPQVRTTAPFLADRLDHPRFRAARHDTALIAAVHAAS